MGKLEIFKPGKRTAMSGAVIEFSDSDMAASAAAYDPAKHEAPFVVGHPKQDAPAYGWAASVAYTGGSMLAEPRQVDPAFAEMVNAGRFKKISSAFYMPDAPGNPVPGVYYLKHVGFLGAAAPAVKGMRDAHFAANEAGVVEFADWADVTNAGLWRGLRDWFIGKFGKDEADKVLPGYAIDTLQADALTDPAEPGPASFTEPGATTTPSQQELSLTEQELAARKAELDAREAAFAERETALQTQERAARSATIAAFVEGLTTQGRVLPKDKARLVAFMGALPEAASVIEFAESDPTKKTETPALKVFQDFLAALPVQVDFSERAGNDKGASAQLDVTSPDAIAAAAVEFTEAEAKAGRTVRIDTAVQHVMKQQGASA